MVDILIFAIMAIVIAYKFFNMLGQVDGTEGAANKIKTVKAVDEPKDIAPLDEDEQAELKKYSSDLQKKIAGLKEKISNFNLVQFDQNIDKAFEIIVESFAKGDKEALYSLADEKVAESFLTEFKKVSVLGNKLFIDVIAVISSMVEEVVINSKEALIKVKFVTEQISYTENKAGEIISGSKENIEEIEDVWFFVKNLDDSSPVWKLSKIG